MGTSSTFLHELLERIQEKIIIVSPKIKRGQVVKYTGYLLYVIRLDQKHYLFQTQQKFLNCLFNSQTLHHAV